MDISDSKDYYDLQIEAKGQDLNGNFKIGSEKINMNYFEADIKAKKKIKNGNENKFEDILI